MSIASVLDGRSSCCIAQGDAIDQLRTMPDRCVHCCVTSPPYYLMKDYGVPGQLGLEATVDDYITNLVAVFAQVHRVLRNDGTLWLNVGETYARRCHRGGSMARPRNGVVTDGDRPGRTGLDCCQRAALRRFGAELLGGVRPVVGISVAAGEWQSQTKRSASNLTQAENGNMGRAPCALLLLGAGSLLFSNSEAGQDNKDKDSRVKFEIRLAEQKASEGLEEMADPLTKNKIYVHKRAALSNGDISEARAVKNALDKPAVEVIFAKASQEKVGDFFGSNIGKLAAIFIDGKLIGAPVIRAKLSEKTEIWGDFTREEAERIAKGLKTEKGK